MQLDRDIIEKIMETFSPEDAPRAIEALSVANKSGRIGRCILVMACGDLRRLMEGVWLANRDCRDIIMAGEYDDMGRRLRDLRVSFLIDAPIKMWIAQVAVALASREYTLTRLHTIAVERKPAKYLSDMGEGTATFQGDLGELTIVKQDGQWFIKGPAPKLERKGLVSVFAWERDFIDAITGYLLSERSRL